MSFKIATETQGSLVNSQTEEKVSILDNTVKHPDRSEKYLVIPTREVLDVFSELGFTYNENHLWKVNSRKETRHGKGAHMVIVSHPDISQANGIKDQIIPKMYLWNSYDGSLRLNLRIGFYRKVSRQYYSIGSDIIKPIVFKHIAALNNKEGRKADLMGMVKDASTSFKAMSDYLVSLEDVMLNEEQKLAFARRMVEIRLLGTTSSEVSLESKGFSVKDETLKDYILKPNRPEDMNNSAYSVALTVQENLLSVENFAEVPFQKTYLNSKKQTVTKERKMRRLKNQLRVDQINMALFSELSKIVNPSC